MYITMKILLISNMYPSNKHPHYGVFVENTEKELKKRGIRVKKCVLKKEQNKVKKLFCYILFYINIFIKSIFGRYDFLYVHYVSHCAMPVLAARKIKKKIRIISNVHGNDIIPETLADIKYLYKSVKLLNASEKIIVPSVYFQEEINRRYSVEMEKMLVFPSGGVNGDVFYKKGKTESRTKIGYEPECRYIGYVSRIEEKKGWDTFIDMINLWKNEIPKDIRFIIVGEGSQQQELCNRIKKLQLEKYIDVIKMQGQEILSDIYNSLDIFCFPTYRQSESLGLVGIEAMACGCVVLSTDKYGPSTYIEDGENGFVFACCDAEDMLGKIKVILNLSKEERNRIIKNAEDKAKEYDSKIVTENLCDILEKI